MPLLNLGEAKHFHAGIGGAAMPGASFREWINLNTTPRVFSEGTANFAILRELAVRETERLLLLSASHYRRAHDLIGQVSCPWAHVTMYYGSYFAATALLGMFGAWKLKVGNKAIMPTMTSAGSQRLEVFNVTSTFKGSHRAFWDFYFQNAKYLRPYALKKHSFALSPISGQITWLSDRRNDLNYDSFHAMELAKLYKTSFSVQGFPGSLPGVLATQFRFLEAILSLAGKVAEQIGVETDALIGNTTGSTRTERIEKLVLKSAVPKLGGRVKRRLATTRG